MTVPRGQRSAWFFYREAAGADAPGSRRGRPAMRREQRCGCLRIVSVPSRLSRAPRARGLSGLSCGELSSSPGLRRRAALRRRRGFKPKWKVGVRSVPAFELPLQLKHCSLNKCSRLRVGFPQLFEPAPKQIGGLFEIPHWHPSAPSVSSNRYRAPLIKYR